MQLFLRKRFDLIRFLKRSKTASSMIARDRWHDGAVRVVKTVKVYSQSKASTVACERNMAWFYSFRHKNLAPLLEISRTKRGDVVAVRDLVDGKPPSSITGTSPEIVRSIVTISLIMRREGITHGNIKPQNVLCSGDAVKVVDGGLHAFAPLPLVANGIHWTAPEVLRGASPTPDSDLYSIGAVLYQVLFGTTLFTDNDASVLIQKYLYAEPRGRRLPAPDSTVVDPALVLGLMHKDARRRSTYLRELAAELHCSETASDRAAFTGANGTLDSVLARLRHGDQQIHSVLLQGGTGAGKTRLLEEVAFRARWRQFAVVQGRAYERGNRRFEPILQVITHWERQFTDRFVSWIESHGELFRPSLATVLPEVCGDVSEGSRPVSNEQLAADLASTLVALARSSGPLLISLDDMHWADSGSSLVLRHLLLRRYGACITILIALRIPSRAPQATAIRSLSDTAQVMNVDSLDRPSLTSIARSLLGSRPRYVISRAVAASQGSPLLLEEWARTGTRSRRKPGRQPSDVLIARFEDLPPPARLLAEALSLFGAPIGRNLLRSLGVAIGLEADAMGDLLEAIRVLISDTDHIAFRHDRIRSAVYSQIPPRRRADLHRRIYQFLSGQAFPNDVLAFHAARSGEGSIAANLYRLDAERRAANGDFPGAVASYSESFRCFRKAGQRVPRKTTLAYADCLSQMGRMRQARAVLRIANFESWERTLRARAYEIVGATLRGTPEKSVWFFERALANVDPNSAEYALSLIRLALSYALAGKTRSAESLLPRIGEIVEAFDGPQDLRPFLAVVLTSVGRYSEALPLLSGHECQESFPVQIVTSLGLCHLYLGAVAKAVQYHRRALAMSRLSGHLSGELVSRLNLTTSLLIMGDYEEADSQLIEANSVKRASSHGGVDRLTFLLLSANEVELSTLMGKYQRAEAVTRREFGRVVASPPTYPAVFFVIKAARYFLTVRDDRKLIAALKFLERAELVSSTDFFQNELSLLRAADTGGTARMRLFESVLRLSERSGCAYQECAALLGESEEMIDRGLGGSALPKLNRLAQVSRQAPFLAFRCRSALLLGRIAARVPVRFRYLRTAVRMAKKWGNPELEAEALSSIALTEAARGHVGGAMRASGRGLRVVNRLAEGIPKRRRRAYFSVSWRQEMRQMYDQLGYEVNASGSDPGSTGHVVTLFRTLYALSQELADSKKANDVVKSLCSRVSYSGRMCTVFLRHDIQRGTPDAPNIDPKWSETAERLLIEFASRPYFGPASTAGHLGSGPLNIAWLPLVNLNACFGGLLVELGAQTLSEREMEFLTVASRNAAATLASLLWSPPLDREEGGQSTASDDGIVGSSPGISEVRRLIEIAAESDATTLIQGESGTGKELVAQAIHARSRRAHKPMVTVDCGAIPEGLIESELFGSKRGAFTGASADRAGLIESADGGTLFLDEIGNTSPSLQAKLLRVLQERKVRRVGENRGRPVDVRLIAATNADLEELVDRGLFRKDLLFRINVLHVTIPPLRDRREDISELASNFLTRLNKTHDTRKRFSAEALGQLLTGHYSGNVRELQNAVERAYFMSGKKALIKDVAVSGGNGKTNDDDVASWYEDLKSGRKDFWKEVHGRYKRRDISREKVTALMHLGLQETRGSYKNLARLLNVRDTDYRRFMDFLRRNDCQPDFRPYRRIPPP